jgi:putative intracellular protease/amidase
MKRRELLQLTVLTGLTSSLPGMLKAAPETASSSDELKPLTPPAAGRIPVAFLLAEGAVVIDFAGPWEVFENVHIPGPTPHPFQLYTVAESEAPIEASGGMKVLPNYTLVNAPLPKIIVIPAQREPSAAVVDWIRKYSRTADLTMSVCTGAFVLAKTGLLAGKSATTHHGAYAEFAMAYPDVFLKRGARSVISRLQAGSLRVSTSRYVWSSDTMVEALLKARPATSSIRVWDGRIRIRTLSTREGAHRPMTTQSVQCAIWTSIARARLNPCIEDIRISSACRRTRNSLTQSLTDLWMHSLPRSDTNARIGIRLGYRRLPPSTFGCVRRGRRAR